VLAGAAQGLLLALVALDAAGEVSRSTLFVAGAVVALGLCAVALGAAVFHLGHPLRAWRAAAMWRTSWLSREVIALPLFMAALSGWALAHAVGAHTRGWGVAAALLALVLYGCTGMIYAAVKAMRAWAHPLTVVNFLLLGLASGSLLGAALAATLEPAATGALANAALGLTLAGAVTRGWTLWRNAPGRLAASLQSAIGVRHPRIVLTATGAMGGSFNTREFEHGRTARFVQAMRVTAGVAGFAVPTLALAAGVRSPALLWPLLALQTVGLLAERWCFFAEARHSQNVYGR
jgi:DMSO reductase anchor subunit